LREYEDLCTLGVPTRDLIPRGLELLQRALGGAQLCFIWANEHLEAVDAYSHIPIGLATSRIFTEQTQLYVDEFYNRRERELGPTFSEVLRLRIPVQNFSETLQLHNRSSLHAECLRPIGFRHAIRAPVFDGEHRHGMCAFVRASDEPAYTKRDEQTLVLAARYLAHAFELEKASELIEAGSAEGGDVGFLLLGAHGELLHACDLGLRYFFDATRADGLNQGAGSLAESLPVALVDRVAEKVPGRSILVSNRRGSFVFRPFSMRSASAAIGAPVAVTVRRLGSLKASLWHASARCGLSRRERQVAVALAQSAGYADIASQLDVTRNTAVSYVRRIYGKLGVSSRDQLVRALLASPDPLR